MELTDRFIDYIKKQDLFTTNDHLLLAVSGGIDSVVLCALCKLAGYHFSILHCNFQLRAAESERDENFVTQLAAAYGVDITVKKFDTATIAHDWKKGIQETARILRYDWFRDLWQQNDHASRTRILTAHHLNDNIETLLMNFFKGTGIAGLRGMLPAQQHLIRPLLFARKEELLDFAQQNNLQWVEDSSNKLDKYSRNYFRHQVLPLVQTIFPQAENNLADNISRFRDIETLYHQAIAAHKKKLLEPKGNEVHIPVLKLKKVSPLPSIVFEIIRQYGFHPQQVEEVIALLDSDTGRYVQSATHRVIRNRGWLIIAATKAEDSQHILVEATSSSVVFPNGLLELSKLAGDPAQLLPAVSIAQFDAAQISFPLLLRKWKTGDYFYPLGMKKKKKVSRFLIDQKLSKTQKENTWLLEMNKKIIWIVGQRIDERFKVTGHTAEVLRFRLISQ